MLNKMQSMLRNKWIMWIITGLGTGFYIFQLWVYSHNQFSVLDEGTYLLKGLLFVQGKYTPFEPFGVWTNHMPLSFLIPGYVQKWFGSGIRVGRYFSIVLALLGLVGVWAALIKKGGLKWGAFGIWVFALNSALIKIYSVYTSQVLIFAQLAWVSYLVLDSDRKAWKLAAAAFLSGIMILTRINMAPVLGFIVILVFWRDGKKLGLVALASGLMPLIAGLLFWPGMVDFWAVRIILSIFRSNYLKFVILIIVLVLIWYLTKNKTINLDFQKYAQQSYFLIVLFFGISLVYLTFINNNEISIQAKLIGTSLGIRTHFIPLLGGVWANAIWVFRAKRRSWDKDYFIFLWMFNTLFGAHLVNSVGFSCEFCLPGYLAFFSLLGVILLYYSIVTVDQSYPKSFVIFLGVTLMLLFSIEALTLDDSVKEFLLNIQVPRIKSMTFLPGTSELWRLLTNKYGHDYFFWEDVTPAAFGVIVGAVYLGAVFLIFKVQKLWDREGFSLGNWLFLSLLLSTLIISPTKFLGNPISSSDCNGDVIAAHETLGGELGDIIPGNSKVFWYGASPIPLLSTLR